MIAWALAGAVIGFGLLAHIGVFMLPFGVALAVYLAVRAPETRLLGVLTALTAQGLVVAAVGAPLAREDDKFLVLLGLSWTTVCAVALYGLSRVRRRTPC